METRTGEILELRADTICVHGDRADAAAFAQQLRQSLNSAGVRLPRYRLQIHNKPHIKGQR